MLKKFKMNNCNPVSTLVECGIKLSKHEEGERVDPTIFRSLVGSLRYLTCTRPDILYGVGLVSRYMESPTITHFKTAKRIIRYVKGTIDFLVYFIHLLMNSNLWAIVIVIRVEMWMIERAQLDLFFIWGVRHLLGVLKSNQL